MKILITGGAGFVGTNLCTHLVQEYPKYFVVTVDNLSTGAKENLLPLLKRPNFEFLKSDISNKTSVFKILREYEPQVIINCVNTEKENQAIKTFISGNFNLLNKARNRLKTLQNFIFISTDEVYGDTITQEGHIKRGLESDTLHPKTPLAAIQAGADLLTTTFFEQYQFPTTVIRTSNLFGPYQKEDKLFPVLISHAIRNEDIPIYGDGTHTRNWLYINDFVSFIDTLIHADPNLVNGRIFNVSGDLEISVLESTELILSTLNKPKDLISFQKDREPVTRRRVLDSTLARETLGWYPQIDFKEALKKTIQWYQQRTLDKDNQRVDS